MIDARLKLKPSDVKAFLQGNPTSMTMSIVKDGSDEVLSSDVISIEQFLNFRFDIPADTYISFIYEGNELLIHSADYAWWSHTDKRTQKLMNKQAEPKSAPQVVMYSVGIANLTESGLSEIHSLEGKENEVIDFINKELVDRSLKSFDKAIVVLKFNYTKEDNLHPEIWFSVEELAEKGVLTLR